MPASEYSKDTERTTDVLTQNLTPFSAILTDCPEILKGLTTCGFINASPIQVAALPTIIAGNDTIVEAKNGTGKTLTFVIPTLSKLKVDQSHLQTVILAPTREIAVQIQQCFTKVGQYLPNLKCEYFIGGTPVDVDKQKANGCQIAVGSPGRIKHLLSEHVLKGSEVKTFILDEVDRLFTDKNFTKDVRLIGSKLAKLKQMIVVSASIDKNDMSLFDEFMKEYIIVKGADEDMNVSQDPSKFLLGIKQYVACVKAVSTNIILLPAKNVRLLNILQNLPYTQCIIFTNFMTRVEAVCNMLRDHNYKADYIRGDQDQSIRLKLVDRLTSFKSRILVATDLIARGIDSSNVDLVINMDCPNDWATYLHRIGRAGRFGNKGNAFTILDDNKELKSFKHIINHIESVKIKMLPIVIEKPILEYADDELEDLNLTAESDIVEKQNNENNVLKENDKNKLENCDKSDSESNIDKLSVGSKSTKEEINGPDISEKKSLSNMDKLTIESESTKEEINGPSISEKKSLSNMDKLSVESESTKEVVSVYGPGITEKESLEKLCQVVRETEKKLIDNNLVNKKLLADRSFVLFDPEPFLDDTDQYAKYSPQELIDIFKNHDSDFDKYEAEKKLKLEKSCEEQLSNNNQVCLDDDLSNNIKDEEVSNTITDQQSQCEPQNNCEEKLSVDEVCTKSNFSNESCSISDTIINKSTSSQPRFTNIFDLFQVPDFSLLKPTQHNNSDTASTNDPSAVKEESDNSIVLCGKYSEQEQDDEILWSTDEDKFELEENESLEEETTKKDTEYESSSYVDEESEHESSNQDEYIENESSDDEGDYCEQCCVKHNSIRQESSSSSVQENNITPRRVVNETSDDEQMVDYEILNDWYRQWKQQLSFIQSCVRLSK